MLLILGHLSKANYTYYKIISLAMDKSDLERKKMTSRLLCLLENALHLVRKEKQYSDVIFDSENFKILLYF